MAKSVDAGRAVLKVTIDDAQLRDKFDKMARRVQQTAKKIRGAGLAIGGLGTAIVAPLALATKKFLDLGDALNKMSARTGVSVQALSELKFAAEQSGGSIENVEKSIATMQKQLLSASQGLTTATDTLAELGLELSELEGLAPEDQFQKIAGAVAAIEDPSKRAAVAMRIFGRSGSKLLPMFESMQMLRDEAQRLGITMSSETAQSAADLGDAFNRVVASVGALAVKVGEALAPALIFLADATQEAVQWLVHFVDENQALVIVAGVVGGILVTLGGTLVAIGAAMSVATIAAGGLATALAFLSANPIVLIIAGIVALGLAIAALVDWMGLLGDESEDAGDKMEAAGQKNREQAQKTAREIEARQQAAQSRAAAAQSDFAASLPSLPNVGAIPSGAVQATASQTEKDILRESQRQTDLLEDLVRFVTSSRFGFRAGSS